MNYRRITAKSGSSAKRIIKQLVQEGKAHVFNFRPFGKVRDTQKPRPHGKGGVSVIMIPKPGFTYHIGVSICSPDDPWENVNVVYYALHRARVIEELVVLNRKLSDKQFIITHDETATGIPLRDIAEEIALDAWNRVRSNRNRTFTALGFFG